MIAASIIDADCIRDASGCPGKAYQHPDSTLASNNLGSWSLQRQPHQGGRWFVNLQIRGLSVSCYAVHDDFGNLQMVSS